MYSASFTAITLAVHTSAVCISGLIIVSIVIPNDSAILWYGAILLIVKVVNFVRKKEKMKATKITYWVTTSIVSLMMAFACYSYLTQDAIKEAFVHLGFPDYFRVELAIAKLIAAVLLLAPVYPRLKEWVYAGLTIVFISAFIAHTASGDPASKISMPVIFLVILAVSYIAYHKKLKAL
jgi:hypothetical protein